MKVHVVYDSRGDIIAIHELLPKSAEANAPAYGVILADGQRGAELDVPAEYGARGLLGIAESLRVDTSKGAPTLTRRQS